MRTDLTDAVGRKRTETRRLAEVQFTFEQAEVAFFYSSLATIFFCAFGDTLVRGGETRGFVIGGAFHSCIVRHQRTLFKGTVLTARPQDPALNLMT
jgi:hypothetical protein